MKFHRKNNIIFHACESRDADYVAGVSALVWEHCQGAPGQWKMPSPDRLWKVFVGGRSGILGVCLDGRVSCVKLYYDARLQTRLRVMAGLSKGKHAYRRGLRLSQLGIPCAQMLGYAEIRPAGPPMVIMELLTDSQRLDHWLAKGKVRREVVLTLARFLRTLHDRGVWHKDLSPRNILIRPQGDSFGFLLLDYEDVRFPWILRRELRLQNLHHLHERVARQVSVRDRLRFLHEYTTQDYRAWRTELARRIAASRSKYLQEPPIVESAAYDADSA